MLLSGESVLGTGGTSSVGASAIVPAADVAALSAGAHRSTVTVVAHGGIL